MMPDGVEQALADADLALDQLPRGAVGGRPRSVMRGVAHALLGATDRATDDLTAAVETGAGGRRRATTSTWHRRSSRSSRPKQGAWGEARRRARAAQALVDETGLGDYSTSAIAHVATARVALHEARQEDARAALARAHRLRPLLDHGIPWLTIEVGLELTRAHLALAEAGAARTVLTETERVLELRPRHGLSGRGCAGAARARRGDLRAGRRLGDEPDGCGAPAASLPRHPSHVPGDREQAVHLAQHRQDRSGLDLPQARRRRRAARRSSAPSRSGSWRARSTRRGRISPRRDDAPAACSRSDVCERRWTSTRSTCVGSPCTTTRSSKRSRRRAARSRRRSSTSRTAALVRVAATDRRRCGAFLVPARRRARPRSRGDERRDRRHPRGGDAGDGRCASRPVRPEGRARARLRRRRRALAAGVDRCGRAAGHPGSSQRDRGRAGGRPATCRKDGLFPTRNRPARIFR